MRDIYHPGLLQFHYGLLNTKSRICMPKEPFRTCVSNVFKQSVMTCSSVQTGGSRHRIAGALRASESSDDLLNPTRLVFILYTSANSLGDACVPMELAVLLVYCYPSSTRFPDLPEEYRESAASPQNWPLCYAERGPYIKDLATISLL
jgi:hypothetical protein